MSKSDVKIETGSEPWGNSKPNTVLVANPNFVYAVMESETGAVRYPILTVRMDIETNMHEFIVIGGGSGKFKVPYVQMSDGSYYDTGTGEMMPAGFEPFAETESAQESQQEVQESQQEVQETGSKASSKASKKTVKPVEVAKDAVWYPFLDIPFDCMPIDAVMRTIPAVPKGTEIGPAKCTLLVLDARSGQYTPTLLDASESEIGHEHPLTYFEVACPKGTQRASATFGKGKPNFYKSIWVAAEALEHICKGDHVRTVDPNVPLTQRGRFEILDMRGPDADEVSVIVYRPAGKEHWSHASRKLEFLQVEITDKLAKSRVKEDYWAEVEAEMRKRGMLDRIEGDSADSSADSAESTQDTEDASMETDDSSADSNEEPNSPIADDRKSATCTTTKKRFKLGQHIRLNNTEKNYLGTIESFAKFNGSEENYAYIDNQSMPGVHEADWVHLGAVEVCRGAESTESTTDKSVDKSPRRDGRSVVVCGENEFSIGMEVETVRRGVGYSGVISGFGVSAGFNVAFIEYADGEDNWALTSEIRPVIEKSTEKPASDYVKGVL